jgi:hypothetical protein
MFLSIHLQGFSEDIAFECSRDLHIVSEVIRVHILDHSLLYQLLQVHYDVLLAQLKHVHDVVGAKLTMAQVDELNEGLEQLETKLVDLYLIGCAWVLRVNAHEI